MLALARTTQSGVALQLVVEDEYTAPLPEPTTAPVPAPLDPIIAPAPTTAPPPPDQTRGEGGTPYQLVPEVYGPPPVLIYAPEGTDDYVGPDRMERNPATKQPVEETPNTPGRVAPITVPFPVLKPAVPAAVAPVTKPAGPITGNVAGFDLARVPLWAWLAGAAFLGAKLLK